MEEDNIVYLGDVQVRNKIKELNKSIDNHINKIEYYKNAKWYNPKHWIIFLKGRQSLIRSELLNANLLFQIRQIGSNLLEECRKLDTN